MPVGKKKKAIRKASAKSVKTLANKTLKTNAKFRKADIKIKLELSKLQNELAKLKKNPKSKKRQLNEYNLFMRRQLRLGKTFKQAVAAWNKFKKLQNKRKPSAYNSFIASQLKQGKSFKSAVALWKRLKSGNIPKAKKPSRIIRIIRKPKQVIKYITRTRIVEKPVIVEKPSDVTISLPVEIEKIAERIAKKIKAPEHGLPVEEIAHRMLTLYFETLARLGLKRSVSLSELVDIYQSCLIKISQKLGKPEKDLLHEEEIAHRLVKLYFLELAHFGKKRTTSLDELIEAYFFVLSRISPIPKTL
jgi:hypothetical protein